MTVTTKQISTYRGTEWGIFVDGARFMTVPLGQEDRRDRLMAKLAAKPEIVREANRALADIHTSRDNGPADY